MLGEDHRYGPRQQRDSGCRQAQGPNPGPYVLLNCAKNSSVYFLGLALYARQGPACVVLVVGWEGFGGLPHAKWLLHFACFLFLLRRLSQRSQSPWAGLGRVPGPLCHGQSHTRSRRQAPGTEGAADPCGYHAPARCWAWSFPNPYLVQSHSRS